MTKENVTDSQSAIESTLQPDLVEPITSLVVQACPAESAPLINTESKTYTKITEFLRAALENTILFPLLSETSQEWIYAELVKMLPTVYHIVLRANQPTFGIYAITDPLERDIQKLRSEIKKNHSIVTAKGRITQPSPQMVAYFLRSLFNNFTTYLVLNRIGQTALPSKLKGRHTSSDAFWVDGKPGSRKSYRLKSQKWG